jgi:hypothetical protein
MTLKSCFIVLGVLVIIWLGVTVRQVGVATSHAVTASLTGS